VSFHTSRGLKLRFDPQALQPVIRPLQALGIYDDLMLDLHLWMRLPEHLSTLIAVLTAYLTHSALMTVGAALAGVVVGEFIIQLGYSDLLNSLISSLGNWFVGLISATILGFSLVRHGQTPTAVTLGLVVLANWVSLLNRVTFPIALPISLRRTYRTGMGLPERTFRTLCNQRAEKQGIRLNWDQYDEVVRRARSVERGTTPPPQEKETSMSWFGPEDPIFDADGLLPTAKARKAQERAQQLSRELSRAECLYLITSLFWAVSGLGPDAPELEAAAIDLAGEQCQEMFLKFGLSQAQMLATMGGLALCFAAAVEEQERGEGPQRRW
jgi:hypothetical protein